MSLKRLVGVMDISVDVLEGRVEIPATDLELDVLKLVKVVRDNGFTASNLKIKAMGRVVKTDTGHTFVVGQTNVRYPMNENDVLKRLLEQSRKMDIPFSILGSVVIPPPKGEGEPEAPVGSLTIENFVPMWQRK